jgi:hypothetical protein
MVQVAKTATAMETVTMAATIRMAMLTLMTAH